MEFKDFLFFGVILSICVSHCVAIICYQCSDSGDSENADCVRGAHGLSVQRADFQRRNKTVTSSNRLKKFPSLKNCSHYREKTTGRYLYQFCKIERVYSGGNVNAYIRDCSNGEDFSADLNLTRLSRVNGYLRPDNQSTCGYSHRHLANLCVQICDTDFCNGPAAGQNLLCAQPVMILVMTIIALVACFKT